MRLLGMADDYGIMPNPLYTSDQEEYYCSVSGTAHTPLSIPANGKGTDVHVVAEMTEVVAYHSRYLSGDSMYYSFYDLLAYARLCRRPEDKEMLQLVFASLSYDIDPALGITGIYGTVSDMVAAGRDYRDLYSKLQAGREAAQKKLEQFVIDINLNSPDTP